VQIDHDGVWLHGPVTEKDLNHARVLRALRMPFVCQSVCRLSAISIGLRFFFINRIAPDYLESTYHAVYVLYFLVLSCFPIWTSLVCIPAPLGLRLERAPAQRFGPIDVPGCYETANHCKGSGSAIRLGGWLPFWTLFGPYVLYRWGPRWNGPKRQINDLGQRGMRTAARNQIQVLVLAREWRFKSSHAHQSFQ